jgi:Tol biopolymer transport system component/tRNA A-37 threonylcarbamoyl transferase component Bud32
MTLSAGTKLGPYEIVSPLGAGGMGEVYRARDTRLDRTVAIKVLNSQLTASAELKARFEREAKVISQLQHPNICVLHDIGSENGTDFLVMEFLEGESLNEKLKRGPLPTEELLKISIQLADALEKAHRAGIIHRDLKPGNVMLTKSGVKLLDFGLAKPMSSAGTAAGNTSASIFAAAATVTSPGSPLSSVGTIIGTVQYMAPEQIQGLEADVRSDIFAFGLLLYEMATGKHAFEGKTQTSVVGQILAVNPVPISTLQPMAPAALSRLVSTCLEKDPDDRFQTIHDVKLRLIEIAEAPADAGAAPNSKSGSRMKWPVTIAVAAVLILIGTAAIYFAQVAQQPKQVMRSAILPPEKTAFVTTTPDSGVPVLSPDGTRLAFVARDEKGILSLYVRAINSLTAQPLVGTNGALHPFWSPDSHNLGFFADGKLKRIDANGGPAQELASADRGRGGAWADDGTIIFCPGINSTLFRVSAGGGTATPATKFVNDETGHRWPSFLPDGKHFIFWTRGPRSRIAVGSLDSLDHKQIMESGTNGVYAAPGYLLFVRGGTLVAQPFSTSKLVLTGDAIPLAEHVAINGSSFRGVFSVSDSGMLVYQVGTLSGGGWQMQWAGRDGKPVGTIPDFATYLEPTISPEGKRIAVAYADAGGNTDVWVIDIARGTKTRLTFDPANDSYQIWTPDGSKIIYSSTRAPRTDIYMKPADGSGAEELLLKDDGDKIWKSISPDGRYLAYHNNNPGGRIASEIWVLPLFGDRKPFPVVQGPFLAGTPAISPDGRWMAYTADDGRSREVYITAFPGGGAKWQVSTTGGLYPKWRGDSKELYFINYSGNMTAVDVDASATSVKLGTPHVLFTTILQGLNWGPYDVTRDGKKFLLNGTTSQESDTPLTLVTNWLSEIKK